MIFEALDLDGPLRVRLDPNHDNRGFFARRFSRETFFAKKLEADFQHHSVSFNIRRGTLRGLHFQASPALETKLVRCTKGAAFDVVVDLRRNSSTFGKWHSEILSADNRVSLYIPKGFAHGFLTLEDATEIDYLITPAYAPEAARGVIWNDPDVAIAWPFSNDLIISLRDQRLPRLIDLNII